ncbi:MAG: copper amine oxidase N-terminal domain-containing protein [Caldisericia bacterium]|nr:copper amine oxidase N-terminal domain-containing protein [Caldisericia bacterium]
MRKLVVLMLVTVLLFGSGYGADAQDKSFNLEVTPDCGFNMLAWDAVPGATQYFIYRGTAPGEEFDTPLLDFPIQDTEFKDEINIKNGQEYCYFVTALNAGANEFAKSNEACAIPSCHEEPDEDDCKLVLRYQQDNIMYFANGEQKEMETPPVNVNSRLFLVVRYVTTEIPGTTIDWIGATKIVIITTRDGKKIQLQIGNKDAIIDGQVVQIDPNNPEVVPFIAEGRTLCPMRFVAENLGATGPDDIRWYGDTKTVELRFDDPMCEKQGILDATAEEMEDGRYRISATYYALEGEVLEVSLLLTRKQGSKEITIGGKRGKSNIAGDFRNIKINKPTLTKMKPDHGKAMKFSWVSELDPGVMYFYGFEAKETKERLPEKGFLGPLLVPLKGIKRIRELDLKKLKVNEEVKIQGFFTHEPYPMLFDDYWTIFERKAPEPGTTVHVRLPEDTVIETGTFISCKVEKSPSKNLMPMLNLKDFSVVQKIERAKLQVVGEIAIDYSLYDLICRCKYGIMFTGGTNAQEVEVSGTTHAYERLRADFVADSIRGYDTMMMMGICKTNMHVLYGGGDAEIDWISADDGDGNPFDFLWTDAKYRTQMENQAQEKWRAGDGWSVKSATKANFEDVIDEIVADIAIHGECIPEITILISDHGSRYGSESSEADGKPGYICSYSGHWMSDTWFTEQIKRIRTACGFGKKPKIRVMLGTCHAGEFIDDFQDELMTAGLDAVCLATCSNDVGGGIGQWQGGGNTTYNEDTGGTYGAPFNHSIRVQLDQMGNTGDVSWSTADDISWRIAHDYASANDWAAAGWWKEHDVGPDTWHQTFPQYWRSSDMMAIMPGYVLPGIPDADPERIRLNPCRFGIDATELTYDICNCHHIDFDNLRKKLTLENFSSYPMEVVLSCEDESMLASCEDRKFIKFTRWDDTGATSYDTLTVELEAGESKDVFTSIFSFNLQKQPLDENGHILMDGGLPAYIEVPIHAESSCEVGDETFTSSKDVTLFLRTHGMAFDIEYSTIDVRRPSSDALVTITNNHNPVATVTPELSDVAPNVIAVPASEGVVNLMLEATAFDLTPYNGSLFSFLDHLDIILDVVDSDDDFCHESNPDKQIHWGEISILTPGLEGESRWEVVESGPTSRIGDKRVRLRLNGNPSAPESIIGTHEISLSYTLNDCQCCERYGIPVDTREVQVNLRVIITDPRESTVDSEFFQAI